MLRRASYVVFVLVFARLRAPGGCPWDRAQPHHTLRQYMIEEACEAADAMEGRMPANAWPFPSYGELLFSVK